MKLVLQAISGLQAGRQVWLRREQQVDVGRSEWSDFAIGCDARMADVHFRILCDTGGCSIRTLGDGQPVFVNGGEVRTACLLTDGDVVRAGTTNFRVEIRGAPNDATRAGGAAATRLNTQQFMRYAEQPCSTKLICYRNIEDEPTALDVMKTVSQRLPVYLTVKFAAAKLSVSQRLLESSDLLVGMDPFVRKANSLMLVAADDGEDLFSLFETCWGKDACTTIWSREPKAALLANLRQLSGSFAVPSVLRWQLANSPGDFAKRLMHGISAIMIEDDAGWNLFANPDLIDNWDDLGFCVPPHPAEGRQSSLTASARGSAS